ncbi:MAG: SURF1 family protein [Gammaproteobacteria bacterium]|nr:SURF1 family protein [Gammaproteobacteria bacterium]
MPKHAVQFVIGGRAFSSRWWVILLVLLAAGGMLRLSVWQLERAAYKSKVLAQAEQALHAPVIMFDMQKKPSNLWLQRVTLQGIYLPQQFLLDNQMLDGRIGFDVLTPLQTIDGVVLVNRGWVQANAQRSPLAAIDPPTGRQVIQARITRIEKGFRLGAIDSNAQWPRVIQYIDLALLAERIGTSFYPALFVIESKNDSASILQPHWRPVVKGPLSNYSYAAQWFLFTLIMLVVFFYCKHSACN